MSGPFETGPISAAEPPKGPPPAARYIHPGTGDYAVQADGEFEGMPPVRQRVELAVLTAKGSAWPAQNFGNEFRNIKRIDQRFESKARFAIENALRRLTEVEKVVRIDAITFERVGTGRIETMIQFTDLTNGQPDALLI